MSALVADTHVVVWYLFTPDQLSATARAALTAAAQEAAPVYISAVSLVELIYLTEKRRVPDAVLSRLREALDDPGSALEVAPVNEAVAQTVARVPREDVPDMPDRIIAATALHLELPLVTRDRQIRAAGIETIW